jgi:tRNA pseudouridine65 synthase
MTGAGSILTPVGTPPRDATTHWEGIQQFEVPWVVRPYMTARYGLVRLEPVTGRTHQLRQHLHHVSHPLVGDTCYGDGAHNRMFRSMMESYRLMLHCGEIKGIHPFTNNAFCWSAPFPENYSRVIHELAKMDLASNPLKN